MLPVPALLFNVGQGRFTSCAAKSHKILMKKRARTCVCQKKAVSLHAILIKSI